MANATTFNQTVNETVKQFIYWIEQIQLVKDRIDADAGLAAAAAAAAQAAGRADLATIDFTNLDSAIGQILFTWNSGSPTPSGG